MKDRLFSGPDVEEALASAAASLGLPIAELRYVVLDPGTDGGRGLKPTPARIAVLVQERGEPASGTTSGLEGRAERHGERYGPERHETPGRQGGRHAEARPSAPQEPLDPDESLPEFVRALARAGGLELEAELEQADEALVLRICGKDASFFHGTDGRGEVLIAFEHLMQRIHGPVLHPRALRVRCEGFRERRDEALAAEARRLAEAVRGDGAPRTIETWNAYERRVVHVALSGEPGVTTFSVGEGRERRVTIAPKPASAEGQGRAPQAEGERS